MTTRNERPEDDGAGTSESFAALSVEARRVFEWIRERRRILVLTHERPDGDALGSLYGTVAALRSAGFSADGRMEVQLPRRYLSLFPRLSSIVAASKGPLPDDLDGILCLDVSVRDRVWPADVLQGVSVCNVDHHRDNDGFGTVNWVDPSAAAVAEMLTLLFSAAGWMTPAAADCLLSGLLTDTGGLRFPNTTARALRTVARLCEQGARYAQVMDALFFQEPMERRRLEAHLIETAVSSCGGKFLYAILDPDDVERRGLRPADLEGLIDVLRSVEGVHVACLIQPGNEAVRLSLRARSAETPVDGIAHKLGGGGHRLAAGARIPDADTDAAIESVLQLAQEVINGK